MIFAVAEAMKQYEGQRFIRYAQGARLIDLIGMADYYRPEVFRQYLALCRAWRMLLRGQTIPPSECPPAASSSRQKSKK